MRRKSIISLGIILISSIFFGQIVLAQSCSISTLNACSNVQVCNRATTVNGQWKRVWKKNSAQTMVAEANRRGLSCNVGYSGALSEKNIKKKTQISYSEKCNLNIDQIKQAQLHLQSLGFYPYKVDGIVGNGTLAAVKKAREKLGRNALDSQCLTQDEIEDFREMVLRKDYTNKCSAQNLKKCSSAFVCTFATTNKGRTKVWADETATGRVWISEAKRRKIDCGVSKTLTSLSSETCGKSNPSKCSSAFVCTGATIDKGGKKIWDEQTATGRVWISEAKRRKIDCGIPKTLTNLSSETCEKSNPSKCSSDIICVGATITKGQNNLWDVKSPTGRTWIAEAKRRGLTCGVKEPEVVKARVPSCDDDPALCSVVQLCQKATLSKNGEKVWSDEATKIAYVDLAKSTGVTCGVKSKPVVVAKLPTCDDDPVLCSVAQLCQKASLNKDGVKVWSGEATSISYVELAKSTGVTCGVIEKPVVVAEAANCSTDPSKCSMIELCAKASGTSAAGEKFWRMDAEFQGYVDMAKIIGVTCGVAQKQVQMVQKDTCETNASKCSMVDLCAKASGTNTSGEKFWRLDAEFQEYVNAAKTIGVTCGVQQAAVASSQQVTVPKPQKVQKYTNRKALVIGNANYLNQTPLKNPINDAKAVAAKLEQVGFEVTYREDLAFREFGRTLGDFEAELKGSDIGLFYYAGHGIEIDKQNYLIPVDAELRTPRDARYETVMLDDAVSASLNTGKLSMVLIDACRDNPFSANFEGGNRSIGRGLSVVEVETGPVNQIISFAAASGEVAEDGIGDNSPYATALIDLLDEPNLEVGKMFRVLGERVSQMTGGKQQPVKRDNLRGEDIFLVVE